MAVTALMLMLTSEPLIKKNQGFTLIELIVVIAIVGSIMAMGLKLLNSFWLKQSTGITSLEMMQLLEKAREKSLSTGMTYSLALNMEKKVMEMQVYDPEWESKESGLESVISDEEDDEKKKKPEVIFKSNIPADIEELYTVSGIKLESPIVFLHFYPNGTGDAIIIKYKNREKPFYYLPHNGTQGVYFTDLMSINYDDK